MAGETDMDNILWVAWMHFWQITVLILAIFLAVRTIARNRPHLAGCLWLVVLLKCVTPPLWASPTGVFCWLQPRLVDAAAADTTSSESIVTWQVAAKHLAANSVTPTRTAERPVTPVTDGALGISASRTGTTTNVSTVSIFLIAWIVGSGMLVCVTIGRWVLCLRVLHGSRGHHDTELDDLVRDLSRRLRIGRRVRLLITDSRLGPAVFGLIRPTISLPLAIVRGKTRSQIEPILAHELMHVRRGDLWLSLLQVLARAMWWFHPLVWWVGRISSREAERCCDEAVIAELGCSPSAYARSLLDGLIAKPSACSS